VSTLDEELHGFQQSVRGGGVEIVEGECGALVSVVAVEVVAARVGQLAGVAYASGEVYRRVIALGVAFALDYNLFQFLGLRCEVYVVEVYCRVLYGHRTRGVSLIASRNGAGTCRDVHLEESAVVGHGARIARLCRYGCVGQSCCA